MAREIESNLYSELMDSELGFIERGIRTTEEIYDAVKKRYPDYCDDTYLCAQNCRGGNNQPEWKHTVRKVLQNLKSVNGPVSKAGTHGSWLFS